MLALVKLTLKKTHRPALSPVRSDSFGNYEEWQQILSKMDDDNKKLLRYGKTYVLRTLGKISITACLVAIGLILVLYPYVINPTISVKSSKHVHSILNDSIILHETNTNQSHYSFTFNPNNYDTLGSVYGIYALIVISNNNNNSFNNNISIFNDKQMCFSVSDISDSSRYLTAVCNVQYIISSTTNFTFNINIKNSGFYFLRIYAMYIATITHNTHYQITHFMEYKNEKYLLYQSSHAFHMNSKYIFGKEKINIGHQIHCSSDKDNALASYYYCPMSGGNMVYKSLLSDNCEMVCDDYEKQIVYKYNWNINAADVVYSDGYYIVLSYDFGYTKRVKEYDNDYDYSDLYVETHYETDTNEFFIGFGTVCILLSCVWCFCGCKAVPKPKYNYTAMEAQQFHSFCKNREQVVCDYFGVNIGNIILEYLHEMENERNFVETHIWKKPRNYSRLGPRF